MNFTLELSTSPNAVSNVTFYRSVSMYIYLTAYSVNIIFGLPANSYVLWLICSGKGSRIVAEFFNVNLTVCEILHCLGSLAFFQVAKWPQLYYLVCFMVALPNAGRPLITSAICIERYLAVLYPVSFLKYKPLRYKLACSAVIWIITLSYSVYSLFILSINNKYLFVCAYLPLHIFLLAVKMVGSFAILRALKYPGPGENGKEKEEANHIKKKAMRYILIITVCMFFQYAPMLFIGILYNTLSWKQFDLLWCIGYVIFLLLGFVSPFLYIYRVGKLS